MSDYQSNLQRLVMGGLIAATLFLAGWRLMPTEGAWDALPHILGGMVCFVLGACALAVPLARWLAEPWGSLYFSNRSASGKAPMYGIPQAKRKKGLFEEAMADYEAIIRDHPGELRAYVEMMDMAVVDMQDLHRAELVFEQGMLALQSENDLRALKAMYRAITSRITRRRFQGKGPTKP